MRTTNSTVKLRWFTAYVSTNGYKAVQQPCVMRARDFFAILQWNDPQESRQWISTVRSGCRGHNKVVLRMASARNDGSSLMKAIVVERV